MFVVIVAFINIRLYLRLQYTYCLQYVLIAFTIALYRPVMIQYKDAVLPVQKIPLWRWDSHKAHRSPITFILAVFWLRSYLLNVGYMLFVVTALVLAICCTHSYLYCADRVHICNVIYTHICIVLSAFILAICRLYQQLKRTECVHICNMLTTSISKTYWVRSYLQYVEYIHI